MKYFKKFLDWLFVTPQCPECGERGTLRYWDYSWKKEAVRCINPKCNYNDII